MKNLKNKRAILYRRVSTTNQKLHGHSLNAQKDTLREFCKKEGVIVVKEFEEDFSAKDFNRPIIKELLDFAFKNKSEIDYILITSWDRFSRNVFKAQSTINELLNVGIEVNSIENWIDYEDHNQFLLHLIHLAIPEVDNRIRSQKVKTGMRQALKEGRWVYTPPKGYVSFRDEFKRATIKPCPDISHLVTELFDDYSKGLYSQHELLKLPKYKPLKLSKSNLSRMLKQPVYAGIIIIPEYKNELEEKVDAIHEPLISIEVFNKTQAQLQNRSRYKHKKKKVNENLPLRGFLKCSKCGANLTGSGSRSKTKVLHYYYHCNPRIGCKERIKVDEAHHALKNMMAKLKPSEEMGDLFLSILKDVYYKSDTSKKKLLIAAKDKVHGLEEKSKELLDHLLDGTIDRSTYKEAKGRFDKKRCELELQISELQRDKKEHLRFFQFGVFLFQNLSELYSKLSIFGKHKLLGSIFSEKLIFENGQYRTPKLTVGMEFIYMNIKELSLLKQKNGSPYEANLPFCTRGGT